MSELTAGSKKMNELFTFEHAIKRLEENEVFRSFAFYPRTKNVHVVGGTLFSLSRQDEDGETSYHIDTDGGLFFSSCGEEDFHVIDDFDDEAVVEMYGVDPRSLLFKACTEEQALGASGMQTEFAVAIINGREDLTPDSIQEATAEWNGFLNQHIPK